MNRTLPVTLVLVATFALACDKPAPAPAAPPAPPVAPPPPAVLPEPPGITAGAVVPTDVPQADGSWVVDGAQTLVSFTIVSNSAGPITGRFPSAASGAFDAKLRKGVFSVDLTKMVSTNKDGVPNPVRDVNVVEAFFGARPFANPALKAKVDEVWTKLAGKIQAGIGTATLSVDSIEGPAGDVASVPKDRSVDGVVNGTLYLWKSVKVPLSFVVSAIRTDVGVVVTAKSPANFNIEAVVGSTLRALLFDTMLAAGCAHQPGIKNDVSVMIDKVVLVAPKG